MEVVFSTDPEAYFVGLAINIAKYLLLDKPQITSAQHMYTMRHIGAQVRPSYTQYDKNFRRFAFFMQIYEQTVLTSLKICAD